MYVSAPCAGLVPVEVKREHLELELRVVVRRHVGAENLTCILCKNTKCS